MCTVWGWGGVCARRGDILPARGKFRDGIKTTNTPPSPLRVQRFNGTKRTSRVVIPPPHRSVEKMQNGSLITSPNRVPAETQRSGFGGKRTSDRERVLPLAAGREIRRPLGRRASIAFVWSAAKPLPCQTHRAGHGPAPHFRAEARTHLKLRAFLRKRFCPPPAAQLQRGTSPPLRNPQLSEGTKEIIPER